MRRRGHAGSLDDVDVDVMAMLSDVRAGDVLETSRRPHVIARRAVALKSILVSDPLTSARLDQGVTLALVPIVVERSAMPR